MANTKAQETKDKTPDAPDTAVLEAETAIAFSASKTTETPATPAENFRDSRALLEASARIEALELELAAQRSQRRQDGIAKFLAENSTKLPPAMREFQQSVSFADEGGEVRDRQVTLAVFLSALPDPMLSWFEAWVEQCFHAQVPALPVLPPGEFSSGAGSSLSVNQLAKEAKALHSKLAAEGSPVTYSQALDQVIAQNGVA